MYQMQSTNILRDLAEATRANEYIQLGVSPRGALSVCRTAKACAYLDGRDYVIPEDVEQVLEPGMCPSSDVVRKGKAP